MLKEFAKGQRTKVLDEITQNDELTTLEKLNEIVGNNYFTNSHRAQGILELIKDNFNEIQNSEYIASRFTNAIKENCPQDFKLALKREEIELPDNLKELKDDPIKSDEDIEL